MTMKKQDSVGEKEMSVVLMMLINVDEKYENYRLSEVRQWVCVHVCVWCMYMIISVVHFHVCIGTCIDICGLCNYDLVRCS